MNFLPSLVALIVGVFATELGQQTLCAFYFLVIYFLTYFMFVLARWRNIKLNLCFMWFWCWKIA